MQDGRENLSNIIKPPLLNKDFKNKISEQKDIIGLLLNSKNLEDKMIGDKLDNFITNTFSRVSDLSSIRKVNFSHINPQPVQTTQEHNMVKTSNFQAGDFQARTIKIPELFDEFTIGGKTVIFEEGICTRIDFMPEGRTFFDPAKITDSLADGIIGLSDFFAAVDNGTFDAATKLYGSTNLNMAIIAQRLGFIIADQCRTPNGTIDKTAKRYIVVGDLKIVKQKVEEFKRAGLFAKVLAREQRLISNSPRASESISS